MRRRKWRLVPENFEGESVVLENSPVILGSGENCDVILSHPSIATIHVQFNIEGNAIEIHDLDTDTGTMIDGEQITNIKINPSLANQNISLLQIGKLKFNLSYGSAQIQKKTKDANDQGTDREWYFASGGTEYGPATTAQVFSAVENGLLTPNDEVWYEGLDYRVKAFQVNGLFEDDIVHSDDLDAFSREDEGDGSITCPYCWHCFGAGNVLFISNHPSLTGDPVLGEDESQRFLPSRFTPDGIALDAEGLVCPDMACPKCHLHLPGALLNQQPFFISIVGAPGSGKSFFLASSVWKLRSVLPKRFAIHFADVDATANQWLNDYEETLFFRGENSELQNIVKTDEQAPHVYRQVNLNNMAVSLPLPSMFFVQPDKSSDFHRDNDNEDRTLILYDNAGEHFQAGHDSASNPGTQHLLKAEGIFFQFDPTEDPRLRNITETDGYNDISNSKIQRQDILLTEMISRIRKYLGLQSGVKYTNPIILGVSKADTLSKHIDIEETPILWDEENNRYSLDLSRIAEVSFLTRHLLKGYVPEVIETIESFAENVVYLPNSALGHAPGPEGFHPSDVNPKWVEVPFLYVLARYGYIPAIRKNCENSICPDDYSVDGKYFHLDVPGLRDRLKVPLQYANYDLYIPGNGKKVRVPELEDVQQL